MRVATKFTIDNSIPFGNEHMMKSFTTLAGMNTDIPIKTHQLNTIARVLYHGNTLLAHCVGAGKKFWRNDCIWNGKQAGFGIL